MLVERQAGQGDEALSQSDAPPSDRTLLYEVRQGSQEAAQQLYQRYAHRLRALAQSRQSRDLAARLDPEDIVQSVFGSFFRGVYRGAYDVPAGEVLWHLLLVITVNKVREKGLFHRAAKRDVRHTAGDEQIDQFVDPWQSDSQAYAFLKMTVEEALSQLPAHHKQAIELRLQGHEVAEIARLTGRSKRSVERNLQEGRERLAKLLEVN